MAMTKKEKAEYDAAIKRAETLAALRWSSPVEKDVPVPTYPDHTTGYGFNDYYCTVYEMWSESVSHGHGPYPGKGVARSASQNGRSMYSTRLLALRALRYAVECEAARKLREIDLQIAEELEFTK